MGVFRKLLNVPEPDSGAAEPAERSPEYYRALAAEENEAPPARTGFDIAQAAIDRAVEERKRHKEVIEALSPLAEGFPERRTGAPDTRPPGSPERRRRGHGPSAAARTFGKRVP